MKVFVTGASGFIGKALCPALLERGHEVSALVRRPGSEPAGTRALSGDLQDGASLRETLLAERPDCVIHLAAEIASQRSARKVHAVNVEGTSHLIGACQALAEADPDSASGTRPKLVFASSVVTGDAHGGTLDEGTPLPIETPYGRSKQEAEKLMLGSGLPTVIVRPSHVYGPGGWYANELLSRLRGPGRFAVIGKGENLWDVVHVADVCSALILATEKAAPGSTFHIADDEPITFYDFMALSASALGVGAPRRIPASLARLVAGRNAVAAVVRSARSSNAKIKRELGWKPQFPSAQDGVPAVVAALGLR